MVKFVSYDGEYPNLCSGTLVLEIDGKKVSFGMQSLWENGKKADYPKFWCSGGSVGFDDDWSEIVSPGPWELEACEKDYPPEIWKALPEAIEAMNDNVAWGCCGGCV